MLSSSLGNVRLPQTSESSAPHPIDGRDSCSDAWVVKTASGKELSHDEACC